MAAKRVMRAARQEATSFTRRFAWRWCADDGQNLQPRPGNFGRPDRGVIFEMTFQLRRFSRGRFSDGFLEE